MLSISDCELLFKGQHPCRVLLNCFWWALGNPFGIICLNIA
uniref:Uncharacterized protein n=1 Tax=Anguilla anguilla TaxID=7936 RepID=A0A0E9QER7_ANGAN